jgi:hypothetical protein
MAERADDWILHIDRDANGGVKRTHIYQQHAPLNTADWSSERSAAATSLASWLSWLQTHDSPRYDWMQTFDSTKQEHARQSLLLGA